jgi:hypothetical protein
MGFHGVSRCYDIRPDDMSYIDKEDAAMHAGTGVEGMKPASALEETYLCLPRCIPSCCPWLVGGQGNGRKWV